MPTTLNIVVSFIALLHIYILVLEMFLWDKPAGIRAFGHTPENAKVSKVLAANQGLYNGFLATGLIWGMLANTNNMAIQTFFLSCILVAGIYGAITASRKILFIQALPAAIGLILITLK